MIDRSDAVAMCVYFSPILLRAQNTLLVCMLLLINLATVACNCNIYLDEDQPWTDKHSVAARREICPNLLCCRSVSCNIDSVICYFKALINISLTLYSS